MELRVLTYNTLFGGLDGQDDRRWKSQLDLVNELSPDLFLMQEAKDFEKGGASRIFEMEARLGMRAFLAAAPATGQHVAVWVRPSLKPLSFEVDSTHFHHALARLTVALPDGRQLVAMSAHLCPNGPEVRRREAAYLAVQASPNVLTLLTGDLNSPSPHDSEPADFSALPAHHRARYLGADFKTIDHSVLRSLEAGGWVDVAQALGRNAVPTVPTAGFKGTEFPTMRCDYVLASQALAERARTCEVIRNPVTDVASDHYPVFATFEV